MMLVPFEEEGEEQAGGARTRPVDKLLRCLTIALRLARISGYDDQNRILGLDGVYQSDTDINALISYAVTSGKNLRGENEFVNLLYKAKVEPELICNETVKSRLIALYQTNGNRPTVETPVSLGSYRGPPLSDPASVATAVPEPLAIEYTAPPSIGPYKAPLSIMPPNPIVYAYARPSALKGKRRHKEEIVASEPKKPRGDDDYIRPAHWNLPEEEEDLW
jgi:hypothetical protein